VMVSLPKESHLKNECFSEEATRYENRNREKILKEQKEELERKPAQGIWTKESRRMSTLSEYLLDPWLSTI